MLKARLVGSRQFNHAWLVKSIITKKNQLPSLTFQGATYSFVITRLVGCRQFNHVWLVKSFITKKKSTSQLDFSGSYVFFVIKSINKDNLEVTLVKISLKNNKKGMVEDTKRLQPDLTLKLCLQTGKHFFHTQHTGTIQLNELYQHQYSINNQIYLAIRTLRYLMHHMCI